MLNYYPETDSLYRPGRAAGRRWPEVSEGIVLDYDENGTLVGIDDASRKVELGRLILTGLPGEIERPASEHRVAAAGAWFIFSA